MAQPEGQTLAIGMSQMKLESLWKPMMMSTGRACSVWWCDRELAQDISWVCAVQEAGLQLHEWLAQIEAMHSWADLSHLERSPRITVP